MYEFKIVRELTRSNFDECPVWSEYYDYDELEDIRTWGVSESKINELLSISEEGNEHPYYSVSNLDILPDRMRLFIKVVFTTPSGQELDGFIINPSPFIIGIFCGHEEMYFNPSLEDIWKQSEINVKKFYTIEKEYIFPLKYSTNYLDSQKNKIEGIIKKP